MKNLFIRPLVLKNCIQEYSWGSHTAIQQLLESPPTDIPWAELWLGAHPKASSLVDFMNEYISLENLIEKFPIEILGENTAQKYKNALPYLFKILAADKPLSIQAHPDIQDAKEGFERENRQKIPLNAAERNYKDDRHKPECICALTRFTVLKGFRDIQSMHMMMKALCPSGLSDELKNLTIKQPDTLKTFFKSLLMLPDRKKHLVISEAIENAEKHLKQNIFEWVVRLQKQYPDDIGILSPIFLNLIFLEPGQSLFIPSGELHSYLDGMGIELMANSDNVIRGGLTPKHIDVPELLKILRFHETKIEILLPAPRGNGEAVIPLSAEEFFLSVISIAPGIQYIAPENRSAEILLCTKGSAQIIFGSLNEHQAIHKGASFLMPAALDSYKIIGDATMYKAGVPL